MSKDDTLVILTMVIAIGALNVLPSVDAAIRTPEQESTPVAKGFQNYAILVGGIGVFTALAIRSILPLAITGAILYGTWRTYDSAVYDANS